MKREKKRGLTRHLIVHLAKGGSHLVGQSTGDDHDVGLLGVGGTSEDGRWLQGRWKRCELGGR